MSKRFMAGLAFICVAVVVLLLNSKGNVVIDLHIFKWEMLKSFAFFSFLATGTAIGFLLR